MRNPPGRRMGRRQATSRNSGKEGPSCSALTSCLEGSCHFRGARGWVKLGLRRPLTPLDLGAACLFRRLRLEPARRVPRIAAASACHRILILSRAPRAARPYSVPGEAGRLAMEVVHPRVAGIDVHKKVIWVAVRLPGQEPPHRRAPMSRLRRRCRAPG